MSTARILFPMPTTLVGALPYLGIFGGMLIEGDLLLFGVAFLVLSGKLVWWIALPLAVAGALLGDLLWYWIGTRINPKSRYGRALLAVTRVMDKYIEHTPRRMLFVSKLTYGLHRPIQMRFGLERLGATRFFRYDLPATGLWFVVIYGLALLAHVTLLPVFHYLRIAEILLLALVGFFIILRSGLLEFLIRLVSRRGGIKKEI